MRAILSDVDFIAGLGSILGAVGLAVLRHFEIDALAGTGFELGPGAIGAFGMVALGRWYRRHRAKGDDA